MLRTAFTELVGCSIPIQQAGMGALANHDLAAAVANAGALGTVSVTGAPPDLIARILDECRALTRGVIGANFIVDPAFVPDRESLLKAVDAAAARVRVVDFFHNWPDASLVDVAHKRGAVVSWQVGSSREAVAAEEAGCDLIVAQGTEAGGHIRGKIGLFALLSEVLEAVSVPVIAAGGIGTGRAMAAALAAGAEAVRVGTRFIAAPESEAHPAYVSALIQAGAEDTVCTDAFSVGWPDAPGRVLRSSLQAAHAHEGDIVGERVGKYTGKKSQVHRFEVGTPTVRTTGTIEAMPLWAGESVGGVKRVQSAAEIVHELSSEAEDFLKRWC